MDHYVYYSKGTGHGGHDDVAICEAVCLDEALARFREYFASVSVKEVRKIDLYREGYVPGVMIVSDY
ncbi:MAG: hypothetical protein IJW45_06355 [Oscillospiraceae bacterium]|nr:hypothetical protein [Oscillospiraceae bacterium]